MFIKCTRVRMCEYVCVSLNEMDLSSPVVPLSIVTELLVEDKKVLTLYAK